MAQLAQSCILPRFIRHTGCNVAWIIHRLQGPINSCLTMATGYKARIALHWPARLSLNMTKKIKLIKSQLIWLNLILNDAGGGTADKKLWKPWCNDWYKYICTYMYFYMCRFKYCVSAIFLIDIHLPKTFFAQNGSALKCYKCNGKHKRNISMYL